MELYEKMDPIEREIMILEAVQGSISIEGMEKAAEECRQKILALRKEQRKKHAASTLQPKAQTA
ncbi:MAG: hypothetical protein HQ589_05785 [Syntrophaceae bacterium]|jgi:hypothetical protein|nr:hypothetical protein [Syntrophaceae bacterium]